WGLVDKDGVWYLLAGTDRGQRTYRVDRIVAATVGDEPAQRPADFDLDAAWQRVVDEMEARRSHVAATVLIDARYVRVLKDHFGRHCTVLGPHESGRTKVRVAAHMARSIAEQLAGWGSAVEVLDPDAVKMELARIGAELAALYPSQ